MKWQQNLTKIINNLGVANGTAPPDFQNNVFPLLWRFFILDKARKAVDSAYNMTKAELVREGVLKEDYEVGSRVVMYADGLSLFVRRNSDSTALDKTAVHNELNRRFGKEVADEIIAKASKPRKGATIVEVGYEG